MKLSVGNQLIRVVVPWTRKLENLVFFWTWNKMVTATEEIVNPNENLVIPSWLNEDYFKTIVEKDEPEYERIFNFKPIAAIAPGENFTSVMIRVHMDLEMKGECVTSSIFE